MTFLKPSALRHALSISRSTEHRLLRAGMPSIGRGRLRRYDEQAAMVWFSRYTHQATSTTPMLDPGDYQCECGFEGTLEKAIECSKIAACPQCGTRERPQKVLHGVAGDH
jgi:hypothetical protein